MTDLDLDHLAINDQLALTAPAPVVVHEIGRSEAGRLLEWMGHYLGPCNRPFGQQSWALIVAGEPVAVAVSASTVSATLRADDGRTWSRRQCVELARLAASERWATRVMLRLWREALAPTWPHWPVTDAFAYSQNDRHDGRTYRFDGWECVGATKARSKGGGTWTAERDDDHAAAGPKSLWHWSYA